MPLKKILITTDGSPGAMKAVEVGANIARQLTASVTLLFVYDSAVVAMMGLSTSSGKTVDDAIERVSKTHIDAARSAIGDGIPTTTVTRIGNPAKEICDFAEDHGIDLIVVGSHGMSASKGFLVGSVSARVARHAKCSVLVVR